MRRATAVAFLGSAALVAGFWRGWSFELAHRCDVGEGAAEVRGAVLDVSRSASGQRLLVSTGEAWPRAAYVYAPPLPAISPGELVLARGVSRLVAKNLDAARAAGVCVEMRRATLEDLGPAPGFGASLGRLGVALAAAIGRAVPSPYGELTAATLLGRGEDLPADLSDDARRAGLAHALVLSGFNVSMAVSSVAAAARFLPRPLSLAVALGAGWALAGVSGFGPSAVRAALGASIATFALWRYRRADPATALLVALLCMSWENPLALGYSLSLQLSALATLGVVAFSSRGAAMPLLRALPEAFGVREAAASTLAAEALVSPLVAWKLGTLPLLGLPANVAAGPAVPLAMIAGLAALPLSLAAPSPPVSALLALPARWFVAVASAAGRSPVAVASVALGDVPAALTLGAAVCVALRSVAAERRARRERDAPLAARLREADPEIEKRRPG